MIRSQNETWSAENSYPHQMIQNHKAVYIASGLFLLFLATWLPRALFSYEKQGVIFNQHLIERWQIEHNRSVSWPEAMRREWSYQTLVWGALFHPRRSILDPKDIDSVFAYVLARIPPHALVYPTETYYYFKIPAHGIAGNLRFTDIDRGELSFAYFYEDRPTEDAGGNHIYTAADGLGAKKVSDFIYKISYGGVTRKFRLPDISTKLDSEIGLLPEEQFVATVRDESALLFTLVYTTKLKSLYYVLDEDGPTEQFVKVSDRVLLGRRTGYAFYDDRESKRKILFGVSIDNVMQNTYYDGPFDQAIPPGLDIRDKLYAAYPYTQYLHGLDANGNFLDWKGSKVAITPYLDYGDQVELLDLVAACRNKTGSALWTCLTYDAKKDFHKTIPEFFSPDGKCRSRCLLAVIPSQAGDNPTPTTIIR